MTQIRPALVQLLRPLVVLAGAALLIEGLPRMLASEPTETGAGPASAVLNVAARTADAAAWYGSALPAAGYPVEGTSGPYEDGGYVIDATGPARGCRVQVALAKMG